MADPKLEEVFKLSGVPTYTFVEPIEYPKLLVALRTPGRGVVIEGPSGIGKTTAVMKALGELGVESKALKLSARKKDDKDLIAALPSTPSAGLVIIEDFHRLEPKIQELIADHLKVLADEEKLDTKLIIVGFNKVGDSLVNFAPDLNNRIDTIRFEANPDERVKRLIEQGEAALNVGIEIKNDIVTAASGSLRRTNVVSRNMFGFRNDRLPITGKVINGQFSGGRLQSDGQSIQKLYATRYHFCRRPQAATGRPRTVPAYS